MTGDDILTGVEILEGAQVLLTTFDDLESYEKAPMWPMSHYPVAIPPEGIAALPGMNTDQPIAWINEYGAGRSFTITIGHDIDTFRRIEFIRMFPRGVEWAATGEVTLNGPGPPRRAPLPALAVLQPRGLTHSGTRSVDVGSASLSARSSVASRPPWCTARAAR